MNIAILVCVILLSLVFVLTLPTIFISLKHRNNNLGRSVTRLIICATIIVGSYIGALFIKDAIWSSIFYTIYFIGNTGLCFSFFVYSNLYSNNSVFKHRWLYFIIIALFILDSIGLIANIFTNFEVSYNFVNKNGMEAWEFIPKWPFYFHLALCYILLIHVFAFFIYKAISVPSVYKIRYYYLLIVLFICVVGNGVFLLIEDYITDMSTAFYGFASILVYYLTFKFIPNQLRRDMGSLIIENIKDATIYFDRDGNFVYANKVARNTFFPNNNYVPLDRFFSLIGFDRTAINEKQQLSLINYDGSSADYRVSYEQFLDKRNKFVGSIVTLDDITLLISEHERQVHASRHDKLTDLYNEETISKVGEKLIKINSDQLYDVIVTNLSQFKLINEYLGQEAGDNLLKRVALVLDHNVIDGKVHVGRLGSDRFLIVSPEKLHIENKLYKEISKTIEEFRKEENLTIFIHLYLGVYHVNEPYLEFSKFVDRAIIALNSTYENREESIVYFDDSLRDKMLYESQLISEIPDALKHHEFVAYVQPQVDSVNNKIVGGELLVRWISKSRGIISPGVFIPLFEKMGYINKLDAFVWEEGFKYIVKLREQGINLPLSVNISRRDVYSDDLVKEFTLLSKKYNIEPSALNLEITESAIVENVTKLNDTVLKLKEAGFLLEMDDFGSGYSSLNTLKDLKVDVLKMDMKFIQNSDDIERSKAIMEFVISLAKRINVNLIAEGVETKKQLELLNSIGCKNIQGYYYSKPIPFDEFVNFIKKYEIGEL